MKQFLQPAWLSVVRRTAAAQPEPAAQMDVPLEVSEDHRIRERGYDPYDTASVLPPPKDVWRSKAKRA